VSGADTAGADVYSIGGTVTGLAGSGAVLMNNGSDALTISANGSFTFNTRLASGASYSVSVESRSAQICTITSGSGTVGNAAVTNLAVGCIIYAGFLWLYPDPPTSDLHG
jgi:hypothetical protein